MTEYTVENAFPERHAMTSRDDHEPGMRKVEAIYKEFSVRRCNGSVEFMLETTRVYKDDRHVSRLETFAVDLSIDLQNIIEACQRELDDVSWVVVVTTPDALQELVMCEGGKFNPKEAIRHHPSAYDKPAVLMSKRDAEREADRQNAKRMFGSQRRFVERWHK